MFLQGWNNVLSLLSTAQQYSNLMSSHISISHYHSKDCLSKLSHFPHGCLEKQHFISWPVSDSSDHMEPGAGVT